MPFSAIWRARLMVEVVYQGGPGDWLFQYCFGRVLAERWGMELRAASVPGFPGTAEPVAGRRYLAPFRCWSGLAVEDRQTSSLVRGSGLEEAQQGRLVLYGWFQRYELYRRDSENIRRWLHCGPPAECSRDGDLAVVVRHSRPAGWAENSVYSGTAPAWGRAVPSPGAVQRLAERVQPQRLVILTDEPSRVDLRPLSAFRPEIRAVDGLESWHWLRTCRRMAIPLGHAADWWAAWLSSAEEIYAADPWGPGVESPCTGEYGCGWLGGRPLGRPDLRVNEPRWIYDW